MRETILTSLATYTGEYSVFSGKIENSLDKVLFLLIS